MRNETKKNKLNSTKNSIILLHSCQHGNSSMNEWITFSFVVFFFSSPKLLSVDRAVEKNLFTPEMRGKNLFIHDVDFLYGEKYAMVGVLSW